MILLCIRTLVYVSINSVDIIHREDEKPSQRSTKTTTGKTKVNKAINKTPYSYEIVSEEQPQPSSCNEIEQLQKEVAELKKQLESKQLQS